MTFVIQALFPAIGTESTKFRELTGVKTDRASFSYGLNAEVCAKTCCTSAPESGAAIVESPTPKVGDRNS